MFKRQLRCLGLTDISEATLKGNIASILNEEILSQYSNPKIYVNALLNCYKCVKYDEDEMSYLKQQFEKYAIKSDTQRKQKKQESDVIDYFYYDWGDLQECCQKWKAEYHRFKTHSALVNWCLIALYSDEEFGAKRPIDICHLSKHSIKDNKIHFTAKKNGFKYESHPLSEHILEPLTLLLEKNSLVNSPNLLITQKFFKFTPENLHHRLKQVLGREDVNFQYLRRLWASYKYNRHPSAKELLNQRYELNHEANTHLTDYVQDYKTFVIVKTIRFKKVIYTTTKWIRC